MELSAIELIQFIYFLFFNDKNLKAHDVPQVTFTFMGVLSLKFNFGVEKQRDSGWRNR